MINACKWQAPAVTLRDGRTVPSDDPEWKMECLARHYLAMPLAKRRRELFGTANAFGEMKGGYLQRHGTEETEKLKAVIAEIWNNNYSRQ